MLNVQAGTTTVMLPIQAIPTPKFRLNSHLLSLLCLIVLCVMFFTLVDSFAQVCQSEERTLNIAQVAYSVAFGALVVAEAGLGVAMASGNPIAIAVALGAVATAYGAFYAASLALTAAANAYWDCMATEGGG